MTIGERDLIDPDMVREQEWQERLAPERIAALSEQFLAEGVPGVNLREAAGDRQFVVAYIPALDEDGNENPYADLARSVEYAVFTQNFNKNSDHPFADHDSDYGPYDPGSTFAVVIDLAGEQPRPAGVLRSTEYVPGIGFKDMKDLIVDDPENPWLEEIKAEYFVEGEAYDPLVAWQRLGQRALGEAVEDLTMAQDIITHATFREYGSSAGKDKGEAGMNGVSMLFFHACLRFALLKNATHLVAIFEEYALNNLQQFNQPFVTYEGLLPHVYGNDDDSEDATQTLPAICRIEDGIARVRDFDEAVGEAFVNGTGLDLMALFPQEYQPELYAYKTTPQ